MSKKFFDKQVQTLKEEVMHLKKESQCLRETLENLKRQAAATSNEINLDKNCTKGSAETFATVFRQKGRTHQTYVRFLDYLARKGWGEYDQLLMNERLKIENEIKALPLTFPNATVGKAYDQTVELPLKSLLGSEYAPYFHGIDVAGPDPEETGLKIAVSEDDHTLSLSGTPTRDGTLDLKIHFRFERFGRKGDNGTITREVELIVNPDPRSLWKELPVPEDIEYPKADTAREYVMVKETEPGNPQKDIVVASKRGRSHAHEGKPRDDDFMVKHDDGTGWYLMAVADGAGSAPYSREGSRIACDRAVSYVGTYLADSGQREAFEQHINAANATEGKQDAAIRESESTLTQDLYEVIGKAVFEAHAAIKAEAEKKERKPKEYATTLLLAIAKRFDFGWFIASFWVGDGALCLYDRTNHDIRLLGTPDEGEFAGQTRFLTMPEIFHDGNGIMDRIKCRVVPDFTALFLMTDGVSDPMFETDANLGNPAKWDALWDRLIHDEEHPVHLTDDNEAAADELLDWLDFWVPGNHDDRTIAILY